MIENYQQLPNKIIKQIDVKPFKYGFNYSDNYNSFKPLSMQMSYLRLGYLLGNLSFIPQSILDIGYGNGDFLTVTSNIIPNCYGYDVSDYPVPNNITKLDSL